MWSPTHVQVTVQKAWGLLTKGTNNTNDCFVTIVLGKVKYQTSVKLKAGPTVEWHEECELPIPDQGNTAEIVLTVLHRNFLGVDEFLGRVNIPLSDFDVYERPRNRWHTLQSKVGKENKKERGELEVKVAFIVKAGSLTDLSKKEKHKSSIGQLSQAAQSIGGSLLSLGTLEKRKGLKKFAKSIGSKMNLKHKKKDKDYEGDSIGSVNSLRRKGFYDNNLKSSKQTAGDADPGVVSDDDEFTFDDLSHSSSVSDLSHNIPVENKDKDNNPPIGSLENLAGGEVLRRHTVAVPTKKSDVKPVDEWEEKLYGKSGKHYHSNEAGLNKTSWEPTKIAVQIDEEPSDQPQIPAKKLNESSPKIESPKQTKISKEEKKEREKELKREEKEKKEKLKALKKDLLNDHHKSEMNERIIIGGENEKRSSNNRLFNEVLQKFNGKSREDLIMIVCELQNDLEVHKRKLRDLEDYLDELLLRVMETTPKILQNPYIECKMSSDYRSYSK